MSRRHVIVTGLIAFTAATSHAQCVSTGYRVTNGALSTAYIGTALYGARLAIRDSLPEAPFGITTGLSVRNDFLFGFGTALSPSLPALGVQAGFSTLLMGSTRNAKLGTNVLAVFGVLYAVGQLAEPIVYRTFRHPRTAPPDRLGVIAANVLLPAALAVTATRSCR